ARFNQAPEKEDKRQDTFGAVAELIKKVTGSAEDVEREAALEDLGVDSLASTKPLKRRISAKTLSARWLSSSRKSLAARRT
ncbi:hypothetical protein HT105_25150, partial [Bacteroides fragilis]|nr:hypothetical protein [Bacteroides fragilis]